MHTLENFFLYLNLRREVNVMWQELPPLQKILVILTAAVEPFTLEYALNIANLSLDKLTYIERLFLDFIYLDAKAIKLNSTFFPFVDKGTVLSQVIKHAEEMGN